MKSSSSSRPDCNHWLVRHLICLVCKKKLRFVKGQYFDYLFSGLCLSHEAVSFTKRLTTLISLYEHKKLHLVLDLDHTLVNSVRVSKLSKSEKYLIKLEKSGSKNHMRSYNGRLIRFRPFVNEFLKEANKLFNMHVYTKASRGYALAVARMLDPNKTYFGDRVITRQESPYEKTLDLVLADERGVLIVDDTLDVWPDHKRNLLQIDMYTYFKHSYFKPLFKQDVRNKGSYGETKRDESRSNGSLANLLKFLKEIHHKFFSCGLEKELDSKDVRSLLKGHFIPNRA